MPYGYLSQKEIADILKSKANQHRRWHKPSFDAFVYRCDDCNRVIINFMAARIGDSLNLECPVVEIKKEKERIANHAGEYAICNLEEEIWPLETA